MKEYDVIVIGSGSGAAILEPAIEHGMSAALVDKGPIGGTCLNSGCIPSKMLVYPADRISDILSAAKLGIHARIERIDFPAVMERMRKTVATGAGHVRDGITGSAEFDFYEGEARFTGDYTLRTGNGATIRGKRIFIASGARPFIPAIAGIGSVPYLTNESALGLTALPESLIIVGGGYIAAEYAHFFSAMGSRVTIVQRNRRLVPDEEPEISALLARALSRRMDVLTGTEAVAARTGGEGVLVAIKDRETGAERELSSRALLIAAGRQSNADLLHVDKTGVAVDARGYITVNGFFETSKKNIWAFGDALGKAMFKHAANRQAGIVWHNAVHDKKGLFDFNAVPHAVFTTPEIAAVGLTEEQARKAYKPAELLVGTAVYGRTAMGEAMMEDEGLAKAIVHKKTMKLLGCHIIGPQAAILIQEAVNTMANNQDIWAIARAMHIHPALSELVLTTLGNLREAGET